MGAVSSPWRAPYFPADPFLGKGPLPASFLFLLGEVSLCVEWLPCILMSLALHGPATSFSCGMFHHLNKFWHNVVSCCAVSLSSLHAWIGTGSSAHPCPSMVGSLVTSQLLLPSCWCCCCLCQALRAAPLSHLHPWALVSYPGLVTWVPFCSEPAA